MLRNIDGPKESITILPLVILAGWLGCQPKSLDRYAKLYEEIGGGCTVIRKIASAPSIVMAATSTGKNRQFNNMHGDIMTMEDFAKDVLDEITIIPCSFILFHGFSNGGCFLWESIRGLLQTDPKYESAKSKFRGIVFDSSPAYYSGYDELFQNAFKFCSSDDQVKIQRYIKEREASEGIDVFMRSSKTRSQYYWENMKNCDFPLQSLYICSKDDKLTPFEELYELIQYRVTTLGSDRIWYIVFENSPHCRHILNHPKEYKDIVSVFLKNCLTKSREGDVGVKFKNTNSVNQGGKEVKFISLL
jgi:Eukaryotic protein of unknown function (DUF829).